MPATETLLIERTFQAPAEKVFDAWTNEAVLIRWFHANPKWETPEASVDVRVGGTLRLVMRDPSDGQTHGGEHPPHHFHSPLLRLQRPPWHRQVQACVRAGQIPCAQGYLCQRGR